MWWFIHLLIIFSVSGTPTGLTATRLSSGLAHVRLSWSTVSGATGYEVWYQSDSNTTNTTISETNSTQVTITSGLTLGSTYKFYVISYNVLLHSLPSEISSTVITISKISNWKTILLLFKF